MLFRHTPFPPPTKLHSLTHKNNQQTPTGQTGPHLCLDDESIDPFASSPSSVHSEPLPTLYTPTDTCPRHTSPFAHLYHTFHDTTQRNRNLLDPNMLRRYVNDQSDHLKFDERSSMNEFLALMITLKNYERSAHSRLRHLGKHQHPRPTQTPRSLYGIKSGPSISSTSKSPTPVFMITPGLSETYFNHTFYFLSTIDVKAITTLWN